MEDAQTGGPSQLAPEALERAGRPPEHAATLPAAADGSVRVPSLDRRHRGAALPSSAGGTRSEWWIERMGADEDEGR